jgi:hypothetical protein
LLLIAVGPVVVVGGLDLLLQIFEQEDRYYVWKRVLTGSFLQFSIKPS